MEFLKFYIRHALSAKRRFALCFFIVVLCFTLVVATLVFSSSMMRGMEAKIVHLSSGHLSVKANSSAVRDALSSADEEIASSGLFPRKGRMVGEEPYEIYSVVDGYAMLYSKEGSAAFSVKGVSDRYLEDRGEYIDCIFMQDEDVKSDASKAYSLNVQNSGVDGTTSRDLPVKRVVISKSTSENLKLKIGDRMALLAANPSGRAAVRPDVAVVYGIYTSYFSEIDDNIVFVPSEYADILFPGDKSKRVEIVIRDCTYNRMSLLKDILRRDFAVSDYMESNSGIWRTLTSSNQAIVLILLLIIVVSSYSTTSATQQIFFEEQKTLGIFRMLGANRPVLRRAMLFLVLSVDAASCFAGVAAGLPLGVALPYIIKKFGLMGDSTGMYLLDFKPFVPVRGIILLFVAQIAISALFVLFGLKSVFSEAGKDDMIRP